LSANKNWWIWKYQNKFEWSRLHLVIEIGAVDTTVVELSKAIPLPESWIQFVWKGREDYFTPRIEITEFKMWTQLSPNSKSVDNNWIGCVARS
jgi:hypothetical protein